jgi:hypothetical protein
LHSHGQQPDDCLIPHSRIP